MGLLLRLLQLFLLEDDLMGLGDGDPLLKEARVRHNAVFQQGI